MQAITTKYHGPTNTRGSRYSASTESGQKATVPANHALDSYENHERAAHALMKKLGWKGHIEGGGIKGGYAFVFCHLGETAGDARKRAKAHRHRTPGAPSFKTQAKISRKIRLLVREGRSPKQATAIAYRLAGVPPRAAISRQRSAISQKKTRRDPRDPATASPRTHRGNADLIRWYLKHAHEAERGLSGERKQKARAVVSRNTQRLRRVDRPKALGFVRALGYRG